MTLALGCLATVFVVVLQVAGAPSFVIFGVHPDLPVVWLACWTVIRGRREGMVLLPIAGVALGLLSPEPLGASLLALLPIVGLAALEDLHLVGNRFLLALLVVFCAGAGYAVLQGLAATVGGEAPGSPLNLLRVAPRTALLDTITAVVWYWPMRLALYRPRRGGEFRRA